MAESQLSMVHALPSSQFRGVSAQPVTPSQYGSTQRSPFVQSNGQYSPGPQTTEHSPAGWQMSWEVSHWLAAVLQRLLKHWFAGWQSSRCLHPTTGSQVSRVQPLPSLHSLLVVQAAKASVPGEPSNRVAASSSGSVRP